MPHWYSAFVFAASNSAYSARTADSCAAVASRSAIAVTSAILSSETSLLNQQMSLNLFAPESREAYFPCVRSFTISNAAFVASFSISFASATFANTNTLERFARISYVAAPTLWKY